jgi:hypothetical protein
MTRQTAIVPGLPAKVLSVAPMLDRCKYLGCMRVLTNLCAGRVHDI